MLPVRKAALVLVAALAASVTAGPAEAQRRWAKPFYSEEYDVGPRGRGYEGFLFPDYYCSYKRYPRRVCSPAPRGRKRCRVVGWRLEQTCQ